jgi:hypothetical protein
MLASLADFQARLFLLLLAVGSGLVARRGFRRARREWADHLSARTVLITTFGVILTVFFLLVSLWPGGSQ